MLSLTLLASFVVPAAIPEIERLFEYGASSRRLRAYAYLTAAFETKPRYGDGVSDVLDCIVPFVVAGTSRQANNHLDLAALSKFLGSIGLNIPLYVLEQLLPRLQRLGAIEWDHRYRVHICKRLGDASVELPARLELEPAFDNIETRLAAFAAAHGVPKAGNDSWADALIAFFKSESTANVATAINVKGALIGDRDKVDSFLIAGFIKSASENDQALFQQIVQIFTGVLIEDFLSTIQTLGDSASYKGLLVFYDTTILLRLLGTSGKLLATATLEMHRALQDLGCQTFYFEHNETEVIGILSTLVEQHELGNELFGETAEALVVGDVNIPTIKDLIGTYAARLGALSIFRSKFSYSTTPFADEFQVDEPRFQLALESAAIRDDKSYSKENAQHDAMSLALVLRLRRGKREKDVSQCGCIFISRNRLLQRTARRFLVEHAGYDWTTVPAILTSGQISTVAWLAAARTLEPVRVTRELLSTCYSAMRPDNNWATSFLNALERFKKDNPDQIEKFADSAIFLRTARAVAQEESLGQTAILQRLNTVEIFRRAAQVTDEKEREIRAAASRELLDAVRIAKEEGAADNKKKIRERSEHLADRALAVTRILLILLLLAAAVFEAQQHESRDNIGGLIAVAIFVVLNVLAFAHLTGIEVLKKPLEWLRRKMTRMIYSFIRGDRDVPDDAS